MSNPYPPHPSQYNAPPRPMSATEERHLGALAHGVPLVAMVLSAGVLGFVASLVIYVMFKDRGPFVRQQAANSLNVQIVTALMLLASVVLMVVLVGFITYPLALVFAFVVHLIGTIKAHNGEWWNPPFTPRFVK